MYNGLEKSIFYVKMELRIKDFFLKFPKKVFFLFGPRGTGKTTWVKEKFKNALYFDLLKAETYNLLLANPSRL